MAVWGDLGAGRECVAALQDAEHVFRLCRSCGSGCVSRLSVSAVRQAVQPVRQGLDQAVGDQAVEGPGTLDRLVPHAVERGLRYGGVGFAEYGEQLAAYLTVRARVRLAAARRPLVLGLPGEPPGALGGDRTAVAGLVPGRADERAEFHRGGCPAGGRGLVVGQQGAGELAFGGGGGVRGYWTPVTARAKTRRTLVSSTACRWP